jgi:hypothetical protein
VKQPGWLFHKSLQIWLISCRNQPNLLFFSGSCSITKVIEQLYRITGSRFTAAEPAKERRRRECARDRSGIPRDFPQGNPGELERIARFPAQGPGMRPEEGVENSYTFILAGGLHRRTFSLQNIYGVYRPGPPFPALFFVF